MKDDEGRKYVWHAATGQVSCLGDTNSTPKASAPPAAKQKRLDHDAAIRHLAAQGYTAFEIRDAMLAAGYFPGKEKHQVAPFIQNFLRRQRMPEPPKKAPQRESADILKVEAMMALAGKRKSTLIP